MKVKHAAMGVLLILVASQLDIDIITGGFKIAFASCIIAVFAYSVPLIALIPVVLISDMGIVLTRVMSVFMESGDFGEAVRESAPEGVFYLVFGLGVCAVSKNIFITAGRYRFAWTVMFIDFMSNFIELSIRLTVDGLTVKYIVIIAVAAFVRAVIVIIILTFANEYKLTLLHRSSLEKYRNMMMLMGRLQGELTWMEKGSSAIENTMSEAYRLYSQLSSSDDTKEMGLSALNIAKDIHEIKKEYYLISEGIRDVIKNENDGMLYLKEIINLIKDSAQTADTEGASIRIRVMCQEKISVGRPFLIMSAVTNLVVNAIEAFGSEQGRDDETDKEKIIEIAGCIEGGNCIIRVSDNGPGIPEDIMENVLLPGYSTKIDYSTGVVGRGLGLAIVRDITEQQLGGSLSVKSDGAGATFEISVPVDNLTEENNG